MYRHKLVVVEETFTLLNMSVSGNQQERGVVEPHIQLTTQSAMTIAEHVSVLQTGTTQMAVIFQEMAQAAM